MIAMMHLLISTVVIAGLILLRVYVERRASPAGLRENPAESAGERVGCCGACSMNDEPDTRT